MMMIIIIIIIIQRLLFEKFICLNDDTLFKQIILTVT